MAKPLTSSQLFRAKQGFGSAPDTVSRKQAAAAGLSPLTTEEEFRRDRGWGVQDGNAESMAAFEAASVMERGGPMEEMPEEYGGRASGSTRRDMRRQMEYDAAQQQALRNQAVMLQMEESEERLSKMEIDLAAAEVQKARDARITDEGKFIFETIAGNRKVGVDQDGNDVFSEPLNPMAEGALDKITNLMKMHHGMENPRVAGTVMGLYNDAIRAEESRASDVQTFREQQNSFLIDQEEEASEIGVDTTKFYKTEIDPDTQETVVTSVDRVGLSRAIGLARREANENKKAEVLQSKLDQENKDRALSIIGKIEELDSKIRKDQFNLQKGSGSRKELEEFANNVEFNRSERDVLIEDINQILPQPPTDSSTPSVAPQSFDTPEEAEAANLPKGTIVVIGGRRARID